MKHARLKRFFPNLFILTVLWAGDLSVQADVLVGVNGERFVGRVVSETSSNLVFDSELAGRLRFPRSNIALLQSGPVASDTHVAVAPAAETNNSSVASSWKPPGVGRDGSDWIQLKSGEWLRGELKYIQSKDVEFDSDELEQQTLKLKDITRVYTAHRVFARFENGEPVYGRVVISNDVVNVLSEPPVSSSREELLGITPSGGKAGIRNWSGAVNVGISLQSGNTRQSTYATSAELARRTPNTTMLIDYLGNYSEFNGTQIANNQRVNGTYDVRLNQDWFVRPVQLEYYQDTLANILYRLTGGFGAGYYVFDQTGLEWKLSAGPSYQYTRFDTVEPGQTDSTASPAALFNSSFEADITRRLTFKQSWQSIFTDQKAGLYTHHAVSTLEFEIKKHLTLDVSFVWDYLYNPEAKSSGVVPQKSDYYLTVGFGVRF